MIKLEKDIPGYRFFRFHSESKSGKNTGEQIVFELEFDTDRIAIIPDLGDLSLNSAIVAVPDQIMDELKTIENLAKLLSRNNKSKRPDGIRASSTRSFYRDIRQDDPRSKIVMLITASPDDKEGVKFSREETNDPSLIENLKEGTTPNATNNNESLDSSSQPRAATVIAGIALAVAIITGGLWLYRRNQNSR